MVLMKLSSKLKTTMKNFLWSFLRETYFMFYFEFYARLIKFYLKFKKKPSLQSSDFPKILLKSFLAEDRKSSLFKDLIF